MEKPEAILAGREMSGGVYASLVKYFIHNV